MKFFDRFRSKPKPKVSVPIQTDVDVMPLQRRQLILARKNARFDRLATIQEEGVNFTPELLEEMNQLLEQITYLRALDAVPVPASMKGIK